MIGSIPVSGYGILIALVLFIIARVWVVRRRQHSHDDGFDWLADEQERQEIRIRSCVLKPMIVTEWGGMHVSSDWWFCETHDNEMFGAGSSLPVAISVHVLAHRFDS